MFHLDFTDVLLIIIIVQLFIVVNRLPRLTKRDYVAEALERDRKARENKL